MDQYVEALERRVTELEKAVLALREAVEKLVGKPPVPAPHPAKKTAK